MTYSDLTCTCPIHGKPTKRASCRACNAAYMRSYFRRRRKAAPAQSMWDRARQRAKARELPFKIEKGSIQIPPICPALGIVLEHGMRRSDSSPSLDRIFPSLGYIPRNVRVISDRANRLKGHRSAVQLRGLAARGPDGMRRDYALIAAYVDREALLQEVWAKSSQGGRIGEEWRKIAEALDRLFSRNVYHLNPQSAAS